MTSSEEVLASRKASVAEHVVQVDRLNSYVERRAKHQANISEMLKQIADPSYTPSYDSTAYSPPAEEVVADFSEKAKERIENALSTPIPIDD